MPVNIYVQSQTLKMETLSKKKEHKFRIAIYIASVTDGDGKIFICKKKTLETMNKHTPPQNAASIHLIYETTVTLFFL